MFINPDLKDLFNSKVMLIALLVIYSLLLLCFVMIKRTTPKIYLIDFACYKPPTSQKASKEHFMKQTIQIGSFSQEILDFIRKGLEISGLGDSTYLAGIFFEEKYHPSLEAATREVEMSIFGAVEMLLAKTGVRCEDIGILIVNCCIYRVKFLYK
ncbi:putative FAE1/Type III polyketide synthase-like protein [Helianthus annuus]|nr:putative FAE1/Type III polyketide synthase-like protein [Helianthus annuus]